MKDLFGTDWEALLNSNEKGVRKEDDGEEIPVVLLAGLQRLAREAGLIRQNVQIITPSDVMVQAIFSCAFTTSNGEVQFVGAADCNAKNTKGKFFAYPTAVAESRAEARCLRKALGIRTLSAEEVGLRESFGSLEASPSRKADSQMVVAIQKLCQTRGIEPAQVLDAVLSPERATSIFELGELTTEEAQRAMGWLNNYKPVEKTVTTKEKRDSRKTELLTKKGMLNEG